MRNIFIVLVLACVLSSCNNDLTVTSVSPDEQKDLTTIKMQERIKIDSQLYKIIERNGSVYLINPATNLVTKQVKINNEDISISLIIIIIALVFFIFL